MYVTMVASLHSEMGVGIKYFAQPVPRTIEQVWELKPPRRLVSRVWNLVKTLRDVRTIQDGIYFPTTTLGRIIIMCPSWRDHTPVVSGRHCTIRDLRLDTSKQRTETVTGGHPRTRSMSWKDTVSTGVNCTSLNIVHGVSRPSWFVLCVRPPQDPWLVRDDKN